MDDYTTRVAAAVLIFALLYYLSLPCPFPGIPYNKMSTLSVLGDILSLIKNDRAGNDVVHWMWRQHRLHKSPIFQIFILPLRRPMLVVTDFNEAKDVMFRRTPDEFDRSLMDKEFIGGIAPHFTAAMQTHARFKIQRKIFQDLMTPSFLHTVAAPTVRNAAISLVALWREKARLANGRAFQADRDLKAATFDSIWGVSFGKASGALEAYTNLLLDLHNLDETERKDEQGNDVVDMPPAPTAELFESFKTILNSLDVIRGSLVPKYKHWCLRQFQSYRNAEKVKNRAIDRALAAARDRSSPENLFENGPTSALGYVLRSEDKVLYKTGSSISEAGLKDELFGYLIAGFETSANTLGWALKHLAEHKDIQVKLRSVLRSIPSEDNRFDRTIHPPSAKNLSTHSLHYLDAVIEEALYHGQTVPLLMRCATVDTKILGHAVPAGTNVFFLHNANSLATQDDKVGNDEGDTRTNIKNYEDRMKFRPERWLSRNETTGEMEFDSSLGKHLPFSGGVRGCFGRRLAYLQMRIILSLIILNFELDAPPRPYNDFEGSLGITRMAKHCYIRARSVN